jgi:hypothetical protein
MDEVEDFLKGEVVEQPVETPEVVEQPEGPVRDDKGRFAPKGDTPETPESAPPALEEDNQPVPVKALQEERRKRQELERRLAEIESRQQPQPAPAPAPSMWEDEQGWQQHFGGQVVSEAVQQATLNARLDMSEMMVRQSHADFEDKKATFLTLMQDNPLLHQKALSDPHPWNFAYNYVKNHERMEQLAAVDVSELEAKLREQIKAELAQQQPAPAPTIPTSLADAQSARSSTVAASPPSLDDILGRK